MQKINLKSLQFKVTFDGNGCVNFDETKRQKFELIKKGLFKGTINDNVCLAKKVYFYDGEQNTFLYKVSSEAIRHAVYAKTMPYINPTVVQIPNIFYNALATPDMISRGYMFALNDKTSIKKKSPLTITDAVEVGEKRDTVCIDFHSRSGEKISNEGKCKDDASDTTIYNIENVGHNLYKSEGCIDLQELQFISADPTYDRLGIDVDGGEYQQMYLDALHRNFPTFSGGFDYYYIENSMYQDEWAERGILLDAESVDMMVKYILNNIMNVSITRRNAWLKFKSMEISLDEGKTFINVTADDIANMEFNVISNYKKADENKILENKKISDELKAKAKESKKSKNNSDNE